MEAKTLNKVGYSSPSAAWTGLIPARTSTNSEIQQLPPILSSEDRLHMFVFLLVLWKLLFLTTYSIIHVHRCNQDGKSTMSTSQNAAKFKLRLVGMLSPAAALTGRSAFEGKVVMCHCGLWTEMLLSQPDVEIALKNVCAKFLSVFTK